MPIETSMEKPICRGRDRGSNREPAAIAGLLTPFELALTKRHSTRYIPIEAAIEKPIESAIAKP